jgi:hypothetical protein
MNYRSRISGIEFKSCHCTIDSSNLIIPGILPAVFKDIPATPAVDTVCLSTRGNKTTAGKK